MHAILVFATLRLQTPRYAQLMARMASLSTEAMTFLTLSTIQLMRRCAYLLLFGELPTAEQLKDFNRRLIEARGMPEPLIRNLKNRPKRAQPMDILQSCVL